jgi:hypothetical protein
MASSSSSMEIETPPSATTAAEASAFYASKPLYFLLWLIQFRLNNPSIHVHRETPPSATFTSRLQAALKVILASNPRALSQAEYDLLTLNDIYPKQPVFGDAPAEHAWQSQARTAYGAYVRARKFADQEATDRRFDSTGRPMNAIPKKREPTFRLAPAASKWEEQPKSEYEKMRPHMESLASKLSASDAWGGIEEVAAKRSNTIFRDGKSASTPSDFPHDLRELASRCAIPILLAPIIIYQLTVTLEELAMGSVFKSPAYSSSQASSRLGNNARQSYSKARQPLSHKKAAEWLGKLCKFMQALNPDKQRWLEAYQEWMNNMSTRLTPRGRWRLDLAVRTYCDERFLPYIPLPMELWFEVNHCSLLGSSITIAHCSRCLALDRHAGPCHFFSSDPPSDEEAAVSFASLSKEISALRSQVERLLKKTRPRDGQSQQRSKKPRTMRSSWARVCRDFNGPGCSRASCGFRHVEGCNKCKSLQHKESECKN